MARILTQRQAIRERTEALLGNEEESNGTRDATHPPQEMPDPFGPQSDLPRNPHPAASHRGRAIRSSWATSSAEVASRRSDLMDSQAKIEELQRKIKEKADSLSSRKSRLQSAWQMIGRDAQAPHPGAVRRVLEVDLQRLRREAASLDDRLARSRRLRLVGLVQTFALTPPSLPRSLAKTRDRRFQGAFEPYQATSTPAAQACPDWTILPPPQNRLILPLPTPADVRRLPREEVNAATALTAQLLQTMAGVCGVALPFSIGLDKAGRWAIRPDALWTGYGPANSKHSLHLGKGAYVAMTPAPSNSPGRATAGIEASMMSLGASTLSALESFVQLPGLNHKTWSRASVWQEKGKPTDADGSNTASTDPSSTVAVVPGVKEEDEAVVASRTFCRALTMLSFDAAYLAWTQGVPIDLLRAGGNALKLLFEAAHAGGGIRRSHLAIPPAPVALQDLDIPQLDFSKLLQLHGLDHPSAAATPSPKKATSRESPMEQANSEQKLSSMEESYVDAGREVAGMAEAKTLAARPEISPSKSRNSSSINPERTVATSDQRPKTSSAAPSGRHHSRGSSAVPTGSPLPSDKGVVKPAVSSGGLEFLRQRGKMANLPQGPSDGETSRPSTASRLNPGTPPPKESTRSGTSSPASGLKQRSSPGSTTPAKSTPPATPTPLSRPPIQARTSSGAVIFNGKEIVGDSSRRGSPRPTTDAGGRSSPLRTPREKTSSKVIRRKEKESGDEEWDVV